MEWSGVPSLGTHALYPVVSHAYTLQPNFTVVEKLLPPHRGLGDCSGMPLKTGKTQAEPGMLLPWGIDLTRTERVRVVSCSNCQIRTRLWRCWPELYLDVGPMPLLHAGSAVVQNRLCELDVVGSTQGGHASWIPFELSTHACCCAEDPVRMWIIPQDAQGGWANVRGQELFLNTDTLASCHH